MNKKVIVAAIAINGYFIFTCLFYGFFGFFLWYNRVMKLRLISDIHGNLHKINEIRQSVHRYDLTVQLGDYGIGFGVNSTLDTIDSDRFKILFGNHDDFDALSKYPHALDRYGILEFAGEKIFYVGGAQSIDRDRRTPGLNWWTNEQLEYREVNDCLDLWEANCANIDLVLSHDCPINVGQSVLGFFPNENTTNRLLYEIWKIKESKEWYFGHYHRIFNKQIGKTNFHCLPINGEVVLEIAPISTE